MLLHQYLLDAMNPLWDKNLMHLFDQIKVALPQGNLATLAKQIAAIFSLAYLSLKAYNMILGEGRLEIMALFRPFIISLAIINFGLITQLVGLPGKEATKMVGQNFDMNTGRVDEKMDEKKALSDSLFTSLIHNTHEIAPKLGLATGTGTGYNNKVLNSALGGAPDVLSNIRAYLWVYEQLLWTKVSMWLQGIIEYIVVALFKGICYCIFFLQLIILAVLTWIGPISFAFSLAGPFRNSWVHWAGKYIAVSFYSAIGFFILNISFAILMYGCQQEIDRLQQILAVKGSFERFNALMMHIDNFLPFLFIALVVAVSGVIATPVISTWIVETAGTGNAVFGGGVGAVKGAGKAAGKAATAVVF